MRVILLTSSRVEPQRIPARRARRKRRGSHADPPPLLECGFGPSAVRADREEPSAIRGARVHNMQGVDCDLPRHSLVVITGPSGSGKSRLAFDTLYAEGQRRYDQSLSTYARQFLAKVDRPDVDGLDGLPPAIAIPQQGTPTAGQSTVGPATAGGSYRGP